MLYTAKHIVRKDGGNALHSWKMTIADGPSAELTGDGHSSSVAHGSFVNENGDSAPYPAGIFLRSVGGSDEGGSLKTDGVARAAIFWPNQAPVMYEKKACTGESFGTVSFVYADAQVIVFSMSVISNHEYGDRYFIFRAYGEVIELDLVEDVSALMVVDSKEEASRRWLVITQKGDSYKYVDLIVLLIEKESEESVWNTLLTDSKSFENADKLDFDIALSPEPGVEEIAISISVPPFNPNESTGQLHHVVCYEEA